MKKTPKYTFTWEGFVALFLGSLAPLFAFLMIAGVFFLVMEMGNVQENDYVLMISNVVMWIGAIAAFDFFVCRPKTKHPLRFNFSVQDKSVLAIIIPMCIGVMFIAEFMTSIIPTEGPFFGWMYESFEQSMAKISEDVFLAIIMVVILAPLFEEIVFRGIIQKGLINKGMNPQKAIWISAVSFGIIHGNPWQLVGATLIGYVLGLVYHHTQSLLLPILIHFINNFTVMLLFFYFKVDSFAEFFNVSVYVILGIGVVLFLLFHYLFTKKYNQPSIV